MSRAFVLKCILPVALCSLAAVCIGWVSDSYIVWSQPSASTTALSPTASTGFAPVVAAEYNEQHAVPTVFLDTNRLAHFSVPIANKTNSTQRFVKVIPSCGCTSGELAKPELRPGESTTLEVDFDAFHKFGKQRLIVRLQTDQGDEFVHELNTTVYKRGMFENAGVFHLGAVDPGTSGKYNLVFRLYALRREDLPAAAQFRSDSDHLACEQGAVLVEQLDGVVSKAIPLTVSLRAPREPGPHQCTITADFQSGGEAVQVAQVVAWSIKEPYAVSPSQIFLGEIGTETTQPLVRFVELSRADHKPIKIVSCSSAAENIRLDVENGPGERSRIRVTVDPKGVIGNFWCRVDVVTDHPTQPSTSFAVAASRRAGK